MCSNLNNTASFRLIEPKKFHHAQQIPVSLSNQQIPILTLQENYRSNSIPSTELENRKFDRYSKLSKSNEQNEKDLRQCQHRSRNFSDTDSSNIPETASESGISDLDMSEKCSCCPYGYHIDVDFVTFVNNFDEKTFNKRTKKINQIQNGNIQKSMEYVIDEVEKLKQINGIIPSEKDRIDYNSPLLKTKHRKHHTLIPDALKNTVKKIDQFINYDEQFNQFYETNRVNESSTKSVPIHQIKNKIHHLSNSSLPSENYLKTSHSFNLNHFEQKNAPKRSYSSCADPILNNSSNRIIKSDSIQRRRCLSNRTSPIRSNFPVHCLPFRQIQDARRSFSNSRRTQSKSPIEKQSYRREIKINLAKPHNDFFHKEKIQNDDYELKKETTYKACLQQQNQVVRPVGVSLINPIEVQEEVLLNLFSCNNSGSLSSDSSESLVEIGQNLKINEIYEKKEPIIEYKNDFKSHNNDILLEKRLIELEKKLMKIPELEIKNNILLEEKKLLLSQLLARNKISSQPQQTVEPAKVYRSIGCDSLEKPKRDVAISVRSNTRDIGLNINEPNIKIEEMETVITNLKDQLKEQTLIIEQSQLKPTTRDVAVMHVVDKIEEPPKPKPELRDVAIHHSTVDENKVLVEKQAKIINDYIKEIEQLQSENCHLSSSLQELIKKHSKHVVTRGTYAPEQTTFFSVGVNTKRTSTRDVQVMYTPKSRDVGLSTDQFIHTRDVNLGCNIEDNETKIQLEELNLIKKKYEEIVQENLNSKKSYRDVNILCRLDQKEYRDVLLGCNIIPDKNYRDVSLKCDMDKELKNFRDVAIEVQLDSKPEQKDANIFVNMTENVIRPILKDCSSMADIHDIEKLKLIEELRELKKPIIKKNAYVSVDFDSRLINKMIKNNYSTMEEIKTLNKETNTDKESIIDTSFENPNKSFSNVECGNQEYEIQKIEFERNKLKVINENLRSELKQMEAKLRDEKNEKCNYESINAIKFNENNNSTSISTVTANINCSSDSNISQIKTSSHEADPIKLRRQSEFEHHRILKTDKNKRTVEETVRMSNSISDNLGENSRQTASWSNKSEINYDRNEITIPLKNEHQFSCKKSVIQNNCCLSDSINESDIEKNDMKLFNIEKQNEYNFSDKFESKNPKSILKQSAISSSSRINKCTGKALTFGENEILETECDYGLEESFEKDSDASNLEINKTNNHTSNLKNLMEENQESFSQKNEIDSKNIKDEESSSNNEFELELELHIACAILNDSLYEPLKADKNKVAKALNLIQQDWFRLSAQKDSNPVLVEEHLNAFYSRFSNLLLERIVNMADLNHNTALHYSVSTGNFEIVNLLLDTKVCDVNAQNKAGYTSIMLAAVVPIKDDFERMTLKRLFSEGNVNIKSTDSGQTALMLAVRHGNKDTVSLLLESSADCNAQDKEGSTALMAACEHGHIDIVRLLLDNTNCDPDIKDNDGETAFEIAKNKNRNDIIVLLYAHSTKLRSHHPAIQFSKTRPRIGSAGSAKK